MNEIQKAKTKFRNSKAFKDHKKKKYEECGGIDKITMHKLRKRWNFHHEDLDPAHYEILNDNFLCCNNMTHKFIHWLFGYYIKDSQILDRIKAELERMKEINKSVDKNKE